MSGKRRTHNLFVKKGGVHVFWEKGPKQGRIVWLCNCLAFAVGSGYGPTGRRLPTIRNQAIASGQAQHIFSLLQLEPQAPLDLTPPPTSHQASEGKDKYIKINQLRGFWMLDSGHIDLYSHNNNHMDEKKQTPLSSIITH